LYGDGRGRLHLIWANVLTISTRTTPNGKTYKVPVKRWLWVVVPGITPTAVKAQKTKMDEPIRRAANE